MLRFISMLLVLLATGFAFAQWKEPDNRLVSQTQYQLWVDATKDWTAASAKLSDELKSAPSAAQRQAISAQFDTVHQQILDRYQTSKQELDWIGRQLALAYLQTQINCDDATMANAQKQLATYQQAKKDGLRVLSDDDRTATIKSFKGDQQSALDEVQQHQAEVKAALDEARQHDADAAAADNLAENPPADIAPDNRAAYIAGQKQAAQGARDQAKDVRTRAAEAQKALDAAQARADAAAKRAAHPEIPVTDDEKAAVAADNDAGIAQAQTDMDQARQNKDQLAQAQRQLSMPATDPAKDIPPENIQLLKKHADDFRNLYNQQGLDPLPSARPN